MLGQPRSPYHGRDRQTFDRTRQMSASTLASWARAVRQALRDAGCDADALFAAAGLDPAKLDDPEARYPIVRSTELWRLAVAATGDPAFGLRAARCAHITSFHALGFAVLASLSVRDAFERCARYLAVVSDAASLQLIDEAETLVVRLLPRDDEAAPAAEAMDAFAAVFVLMCRARLGRNFAPTALHLRRPDPDDPAPWQQLFRCPMTFAAEVDQVSFPAAEMNQPLDSASPALAVANEAIVQQLMAQRQQPDLVARVRQLVGERLPQGDPGEAAIAEALHLSLRSLQRKLAEQGCRYGDIVRETRESLARHHLQQGRHSVSEIAYLLGFGDVSSFTRAFKRWTGCPPSQFAGRP